MESKYNRTVAAPSYVKKESNEDAVTVDWFFGKGHIGTKIWQDILMVIGVFFAALPIFITVKTMLATYMKKGETVWSYREGFKMWQDATHFFFQMLIFFVVIFLVLYIINVLRARHERKGLTVDAERVAYRMSLAEEMYDSKYGPRAFRMQRQNIRVAGYDDVETYELRDRIKYFEMTDGE